MREILFRGQDDRGTWYEGDYEHSTLSDGTPFAYISGWGKFGKIVKPETVGQYTGFIDRSGQKIFEGDIMKHEIDDAVWLSVVVWHDGAFCTQEGEHIPERFEGFDAEYGLVIGNIYDNPELLQGDNNED